MQDQTTLGEHIELAGRRVTREACRVESITLDSCETSSAARGACAAGGIHNAGVLLVPGRSYENAGAGGAPSNPPVHSDRERRARRAMLDAGWDL